MLNKTCPKWGILVVGLKYAIAMPIIAKGLTNHHLSIKPKWIPLLGKSSKTSPIYGINESLKVAIPTEPI